MIVVSAKCPTILACGNKEHMSPGLSTNLPGLAKSIVAYYTVRQDKTKTKFFPGGIHMTF